MLTGSDPPSGPCSTPSSSPDSRRPARRKRGRAHSHRDGCASPSRGPAGASRGARLQSSPQALTGSVALELARRVPPASCPGGCTCPSPRAAMKTDSSEKPSHSLPVVRLPRYTTHDTRRKTRRGEPGEGGRGRGRAAHTTGSHQPSATRSAVATEPYCAEEPRPAASPFLLLIAPRWTSPLGIRLRFLYFSHAHALASQDC